MNLCLPDKTKSCAACCGLYNVGEGTKDDLWKKLSRRTEEFRTTERSADALEEFKEAIRASENSRPLDRVIHVCEFTGFLDQNGGVVGCMLHPLSPGNDNIDLRGMCHYGSMACKSFYCPAWKELPRWMIDAIVSAVDDWHLYGLVVTDVDFVTSVFAYLAAFLRVEGEILFPDEALTVLGEVFSLKNRWPHAEGSSVRRSRYYFRGLQQTKDPEENIRRITQCLNFNYSLSEVPTAPDVEIRQSLEKLVDVLSGSFPGS